MTINKSCGSGPKAAHGTKLLPEDAMVREALLDPLAQDPFAFSIGNRDGRKISLCFYGQVLLEVAQSDLARLACDREGRVKKFVEGGWDTLVSSLYHRRHPPRDPTPPGDFQQRMRFYLSIVMIACTTYAW